MIMLLLGDPTCYRGAMRVAAEINLTPGAREALEEIVRAKTSEQRAVLRSQVVLLASEGWTNQRISKRIRLDVNSVGKWRTRYASGGLEAILQDAPGRGRKPSIAPEIIDTVVRRTREELPPANSQWSRATMSKSSGLSESTIGRIWRAHGLKPHRVVGFKLSNDRQFAEKLTDIVGLYLSPPENAVVFSVDEKSQIQALDRTQPGLPMK